MAGPAVGAADCDDAGGGAVGTATAREGRMRVLRLERLPRHSLSLAALTCVVRLDEQPSPPRISNDAPVWSGSSAWQVGTRPLLEVGRQGNDLQFTNIRGVARLADGRIAVANGGGSEIIFLNPDGSLHVRAGRSGGGPGELRHVASLGLLRPDRVWAFDTHRGAVSIFDDEGRFIHEYTAGSPPSTSLSDSRSTTSERLGYLAWRETKTVWRS